MRPDYHIGLPQWSHPGWAHTLLAGADPQSSLRGYAKSFNTVEGNTTFYGLPSVQAVQRWRFEVDEHFRFCFKFPQRISHQLELRGCDEELLQFLTRLAPLEQRLGVLWLQLPARFSPTALPVLAQFLAQLPAGFTYGVEVRHAAFCSGDGLRRLDDLLLESGASRVGFDTRALFENPPDDPITREALQQKPRLPLVEPVGRMPLLRFISPLNRAEAEPWLAFWVDRVAQWLGEGRTPWLFFHTPDNREAPELAARFASLLNERRPSRGFRRWGAPVQQQSELFG